MKQKAGKEKGWKKPIMTTLTVLAITFMLAGFIGFLAASGLLVMLPFMVGMARTKGGIRGFWSEASRGKKVAIVSILAIVSPILIIGVLWLLVGTMDILIDALIILPIVYIVIWVLWGRKHRKADYAEEGASRRSDTKGKIQGVFSSPLVTIVCVMVIVGILLFSGSNILGDAAAKDKAKDMAGKNGGTGVTPSSTLNPVTGAAMDNKTDSDQNHSLIPDTPLPPVMRTHHYISYLMVQTYDPTVTTSVSLGVTDPGPPEHAAIEIPVTEQNFTYRSSASRYIRGDSGLPVMCVSRVRVTLTGESGGDAMVVTNTNGLAKFVHVPIGVYTIKWSKGGYADVSKQIDLGDIVLTTKEPDLARTFTNETNATYIDNFYAWTPKKSVYLQMSPMGQEFTLTVEITQANETITDYMKPEDYLSERAKLLWLGRSDWNWGKIRTEVASMNTTDFPIVGNHTIPKYRIAVLINGVQGTSAATIANIDRQQMWYGWSGLPSQPYLVNNIFSFKMQMNSAYNSIWGFLNQMASALQATYSSEGGGTTTVTGTGLGELKYLYYGGHRMKITAATEIMGDAEPFNEVNTYVTQIPTSNSDKIGDMPINATREDSLGTSAMVARTYRFFAYTPHGGDIHITYSLSVFFTEYSRSKVSDYAPDPQGVTIPVSGEVTLTNEFSAVQTAMEGGGYNIPTTVYDAPEGGVDTDTTFDWGAWP